jgi:hypothetical protein
VDAFRGQTRAYGFIHYFSSSPSHPAGPILHHAEILLTRDPATYRARADAIAWPHALAIGIAKKVWSPTRSEYATGL